MDVLLRRKKTAKKRREQRAPAHARALQLLLKGVGEIEAHRGGALTKAGMLLKGCLCVVSSIPEASSVPQPRWLRVKVGEMPAARLDDEPEDYRSVDDEPEDVSMKVSEDIPLLVNAVKSQLTTEIPGGRSPKAALEGGPQDGTGSRCPPSLVDLPGSSSAGGGLEELLVGWSEVIARSTGRSYYYNKLTGASQYERPSL